MTATPIPRTLAQTVYGDLDVTEIARPPRGRRPVITSWVSHERSAEAYKRLRMHLDDGRQAYVVCPLVSESETIEARAAEQEAERLRSAELRGYRVGSLHGRLRPADRRALMDEFKRGELDVLVATTVIEVGVDVPNATIMIVQEADRFGSRSCTSCAGGSAAAPSSPTACSSRARRRSSPRRRSGACRRSSTRTTASRSPR
jgi:ATP-dependent DNA helicase RecG